MKTENFRWCPYFIQTQQQKQNHAGIPPMPLTWEAVWCIKDASSSPLGSCQRNHPSKITNTDKVLEKRFTNTLLMRIEIGITIREHDMEIPRKIKVDLPCDPNTAPWNTGRRNEIRIWRGSCILMVIAAQFPTAKTWINLDAQQLMTR